MCYYTVRTRQNSQRIFHSCVYSTSLRPLGTRLVPYANINKSLAKFICYTVWARQDSQQICLKLAKAVKLVSTKEKPPEEAKTEVDEAVEVQKREWEDAILSLSKAIDKFVLFCYLRL